MKRIIYTVNFIPYFVIGKGIAKFSYLTPGTNGAMFTYLTPGINRVLYSKYYSTKKTYSKEMGVIYTNFIKALLHNRLNLDSTRFKKNEEIINYLEGFQGDKLFSRQQISKFKAQGEFERVPLTPKSKEFIDYVKITFNNFDGFEFALVKPITKEENNSLRTQLVIPTSNKKTTKHEPTIESVKIVTGALPTIVQKESTVVNLEATPMVVHNKDTITETITKIVEPVVTETIVKVVEPVAKVVEPVIKVVETITKPIADVIPNIIINNANTNSAHATTVTSNTQVASSSWDSLLSLFGLNKIAKFIKEIFGFDGDGIIFFLIQLPYLIWFLLAFKDNPDIMKYLTDNLGIEEYNVPDTELAPIEYDFEMPIDFDNGSSSIDAASEADFTEEVSREYSNNSGIEYFDYFDYYHSKSNNINDNDLDIFPTSKEVVEDLKDIGNNLLDSTKDKVNKVVTAIVELEPIKDKPSSVHIIDDQFLTSYGAIDVFPVTKEVQSMKDFSRATSMINSNRTSTGGFIKWLFPMLDFDNLYYHPSYFEKFNMDTKVQPITNKVDYIKMLVNELYYALELSKIEIPKVNLPEFVKATSNRIGVQSHADTLSALEGLNTNTITTRRTPNWRNTSLISDNTGFSTYFYRDKPRDILIPRIPSVNSDISGIGLDPPRTEAPRTPPSIPLFIDTKTNSWVFESPLPSVNPTPIRPLTTFDLDDDFRNTTNALATKQDTKIGIHDLLNIKSAIVEVDTKIVKLKDQFIEFHHKINRFDEQIAELDKQKLHLTNKFNQGKLTTSDWGQLKNVKKQLEYMLDAKANLEASHTLNNDELKSLDIKKSSLIELKNKYEKLLGNIATTPNV
jgi:hypothetical protein